MKQNALSAAPRRRRGSTKGALLASVLAAGLCFYAGNPAYGQQTTLSIDPNATVQNSAYNLVFGQGFTTRYGQTFTAPLSAGLTGLSFNAQGSGMGQGNLTVSAGLYVWSNNAPSGQNLIAATPLTIVNTASMNRQIITLPNFTPLVALNTNNTTYIVLVEYVSGNGVVEMGISLNSPYANGQLNYFFNNNWLSPFASADAVFDLTFGSLAPPSSSAPSAPSAPPGPDAVNTLFTLLANSGAVRSVLGQRAATATFALDYDCSVFDEYGLCVSVGARNSQIGSDYADSGETAGLLTAAYRVTPEFRIGGFIDQNLVSQSPVGVDPKNTQPMLGAFAVYQENQDFSGLTVRGALAYQEGDLRITRPELPNTEAGTGRTRTTALAFGGEIAYGFPIDSTWVAQPYAGLRRSDSQRQGYVETTSDAVQFPITYNDFGQQVTSGTAGLRLRGAITPEFSLTFGAGMEYDLNSKMDRYTGTSTSTLAAFSINASQEQNELRAVGSAGMRYMVASNQAIAFDASVRQMPYGNDPAITTMLRYSIGF
jgi:hypothetical protein